MTEPFEQWAPAFFNPLPDNELRSIGRIAVMWSQIDHYTDKIIMGILNLKPKPYETLMMGRMLGSKLQALLKIINEISDPEARAAVAEFRSYTDALLEDRNGVFHGLWTVYASYDGKPPTAKARSTKRPNDPIPAERITELEKRTARATVLVARAEAALRGHNIPKGQAVHITIASFEKSRTPPQ